MTRLDKNLIPDEVFDNWLKYHGIYGQTEDIIKAYEGIKAAQITKP